MSSGIKSVFGGRDNSAQESQEEANARSIAFTKEQAEKSRADALSLFPAAEKNILAGGQAALDLLGGLVPQQVNAMRAGSSAARNAILGTGQGDVDFTPDYSILQQILPALRNPNDRFGAASKIEGSPVYVDPNAPADPNANAPDWMKGLSTNEDVLSAASAGKIPGLSESDRNWYGIWLKQAADRDPGLLKSTGFLDNTQNLIDTTIGQPGGLNPNNEQKFVRLLEALNTAKSGGTAGNFLGGTASSSLGGSSGNFLGGGV